MASKFSTLLTLGGLGLLAFNSLIYVVDPGEKALIMNAVTGLKKTVYNQGYNIKIPFIEVSFLRYSHLSFTMQDSNPSIFMSLLEQKICKQSVSRSESFNNLYPKNFQISTSFWEKIIREKFLIR